MASKITFADPQDAPITGLPQADQDYINALPDPQKLSAAKVQQIKDVVNTNADELVKATPTPFSALSISSGTATWATAGNFLTRRTLTLTTNTTLAITGAVNGAEGTLIITQDGTGGRTLTLPSGPVVGGGLNTAAGGKTMLSWVYDGSGFIFIRQPLS